jgi:hypothetical protein
MILCSVVYSEGSYALYLVHWARCFTDELKFNYAKYRAGLDLGVYQALEYTLWNEMSSMFDRKGSCT